MLPKPLSAQFMGACLALISNLCGSLINDACAQELLIVTAPQSPPNQLSIRKLTRIYQRKILIGSNGIEWFPINLPSQHPLRQGLSQRLFKQRPEDMTTYWGQQYYQGVSPPYVLQSQEAVIRFVNQRPGAIGYILPCQLDERVKVVSKLEIQLAADVDNIECLK